MSDTEFDFRAVEKEKNEALQQAEDLKVSIGRTLAQGAGLDPEARVTEAAVEGYFEEHDVEEMDLGGFVDYANEFGLNATKTRITNE